MDISTWETRFNNPRFGVTVLLSSLIVIAIISFIILSTTSTSAEKEAEPQESFPTFGDR